MADLVLSILAHHEREDSLLEADRGVALTVTAVHEDVALPAVAMKVTVQQHLSLRQQSGEQRRNCHQNSTEPLCTKPTSSAQWQWKRFYKVHIAAMEGMMGEKGSTTGGMNE